MIGETEASGSTSGWILLPYGHCAVWELSRCIHVVKKMEWGKGSVEVDSHSVGARKQRRWGDGGWAGSGDGSSKWLL